MKNIADMLSGLFTLAVDKCYPDACADSVVPIFPAMSKFGDYQCNIALPIANVRHYLIYIVVWIQLMEFRVKY